MNTEWLEKTIERLEARAVEAGYPKSELYRDAVQAIRMCEAETIRLQTILGAIQSIINKE